jgi:succinate dehydrogenase flavin-adding protein (antitoxin of CptAB toxin-antitoxin module)
VPVASPFAIREGQFRGDTMKTKKRKGKPTRGPAVTKHGAEFYDAKMRREAIRWEFERGMLSLDELLDRIDDQHEAAIEELEIKKEELEEALSSAESESSALEDQVSDLEDEVKQLGRGRNRPRQHPRGTDSGTGRGRPAESPARPAQYRRLTQRFLQFLQHLPTLSQ